MALTLVTGLPGHGKTLYALRWVQDLALREGRAVFFHGIKDLTLPWTPWKPDEWQDLEPGAILVIDECQSVFPVRGRGQPESWIEELAKHRHKGIDFVLITQNPMLMDSFVRRLIDRHFHLVRKFGTQFATVHEFPNGVKENVASSRDGSIRHEWRYPKEVFNWYKSAELHTVKRRIPARVWVLLAIPLLIAASVWVFMDRNAARIRGEPSGSTLSRQGLRPSGAGSPGPAGAAPAAIRTTAEYLAMHVPRVPGLAYTAPVYDEVTKPAHAPFPAACVQMGTKCGCYSKQGTGLDVPEDLCRHIVERGFFQAWSEGQGEARRAPL